MALQISLTAEQSGIGAAIPAAYAKISEFHYTDNDGKIIFLVQYFWAAAARSSGLRPIGGQSFVYDAFDFNTAASIKTVLYDFLKTLPMFSGAVDV